MVESDQRQYQVAKRMERLSLVSMVGLFSAVKREERRRYDSEGKNEGI